MKQRGKLQLYGLTEEQIIGFHDRLADGSIKENINDARQDGDKNDESVVLLNLVIQFPYLCYGNSHLMILICSFKMLNPVLINNSLLFIILK